MATLEELIANMPTSDTRSDDGSKLIGIPEQYAFQRPGTHSYSIAEPGTGDMDRGYQEIPAGVDRPIPNPDPNDPYGGFVWEKTKKRVYSKGDEYAPANAPREAQIDLQSKLVAAGLIKKGDKFQLGVWDSVTRTAYRKLLEYANSRGMDDEEALVEYMNSQTVDTEPDADQRAPLTYKIPDKETLRNAVQQTAASVIGRKVDDATLDRISNSYIAALKGVQEQNYNNEVVPGAALAEEPDAQLFAQQQVQSQNPQESHAYDYLQAYNEFDKLIQGAASSVRQY